MSVLTAQIQHVGEPTISNGSMHPRTPPYITPLLNPFIQPLLYLLRPLAKPCPLLLPLRAKPMASSHHFTPRAKFYVFYKNSAAYLCPITKILALRLEVFDRLFLFNVHIYIHLFTYYCLQWSVSAQFNIIVLLLCILRILKKKQVVHLPVDTNLPGNVSMMQGTIWEQNLMHTRVWYTVWDKQQIKMKLKFQQYYYCIYQWSGVCDKFTQPSTSDQLSTAV